MTSERARVVRELAGFKLLKELGQGGMGKVFLARQTSLDRHVALKVLPPELNFDVEFVQRFDREAKAAALFQHPHVVAVYDQGRDAASGVRYIAFEYVDGGSLDDLLEARGGRLPEAEALAIGRAVAMALEYAETKDLVHRDVKPENILLTRAGVPKLADLGLAKQAGGGTNVTQTGVVLGTPLYMAPEQALGEPDLDVRADLYALGLCLWRALTGLVPFDEDRSGSSLQILTKHIHQDLPDVRARAPEVSEGAAKVIAWLAARDRTRRYPSAGQAVLDLDRVLSGLAPIGPKDPGSDTTVLYGSAEAQALLDERRAARRASGAHRRPSSARQPAAPAAPAPAGRLPHPSVFVIALLLVGALGVGIGLALATSRGRGKRDAPDRPAPGRARPVAPTTSEAAPEARPEPAPQVVEDIAPTPPAPEPRTTTTTTTRTTPVTPVTPVTPTAEVEEVPVTPVAPPSPAAEPVELAPLERALDELKGLLAAPPDALRSGWSALRPRLGDAAREAKSEGAGARLTAVVDALVEAVEAPAAARADRRAALGAALGAGVVGDEPGAPLVAARLEHLRAALHDVEVLERGLGAVTRDGLRGTLAALRTDELTLAAWELAARCLRADWGPDAERRLAAGPRRGERPGSRPGALGQLVDTTDLAAVEALKGGRGGPLTALARHALTRAPDGPPSPFLAARVERVPTSSTGVPLGRPRGVLVVFARPLGADDRLELSVGSARVVVTRAELTIDGRARPAPRWAKERPAVLLEMARPRPLLVSLDAGTGDVVDVERLEGFAGRDRFLGLSYAATVGLDDVVLLHPLGEAEAEPDDEAEGR